MNYQHVKLFYLTHLGIVFTEVSLITYNRILRAYTQLFE